MKVQTPPLKPFKWFKNPPANPDTPSCDVDKGMLDLLFLTARIVRSKVTNHRNVALDKKSNNPNGSLFRGYRFARDLNEPIVTWQNFLQGLFTTH